MRFLTLRDRVEWHLAAAVAPLAWEAANSRRLPLLFRLLLRKVAFKAIRRANRIAERDHGLETRP